MEILRAAWRWLTRPLGEIFVPVDPFRAGYQFSGQGVTVGAGKVGQGLDANVVMAPVQWLQRSFTQAEPMVERKRAGRWVAVDEHPLELRLREPNPFYGSDTLFKAMLLSYVLDGNAYWLKVRDELLRVVELWWIPHWTIRPRWPEGGGTFISHYEYTPRGGRPDRVAVGNVVHFRFGLDPRNPRLGLSPLKAALREVLTDEEASAFSAHLLANMGVPGGIIAPKSVDYPIPPKDAEDLKTYMTESFTGKNRGEWMVFTKPTEISQFGFDPNNLQLGPLRDISEERVCAMLGIPAAVVGFGAGLQQTKVGATMRELVRLARVNCVEPMQSTIGRQATRQLMPDFDGRPRSARLTFDNSGVGMFQEDETEAAKRAGELYEKGVAKRNEARAMVRLEADPDGDVYRPESPAPSSGDEGGGEGGGGGAGFEGGSVGAIGAPSSPPPPPVNRLADPLHSQTNGGGTP